MARPEPSSHAFSLLLGSARNGAHVNLTSSRFRLSDEQAEALLREVVDAKGKLVLRESDYDCRSLVLFRLIGAGGFLVLV